MKLWLDDRRRPPSSDWTWVKTVDDAVEILVTGRVETASLDHDLSAAGATDQTGRDLLAWMSLHDVWPSAELRVHSGDPEARELMAELIATEGPFRRLDSEPVFVWQERELGPGDA